VPESGGSRHRERAPNAIERDTESTFGCGLSSRFTLGTRRRLTVRPDMPSSCGAILNALYARLTFGLNARAHSA
jgi:hypothetical protein